MRPVMNAILFAALFLGLVCAGNPRSALASGYDGNWSVLIITEKGTCERGYRYNVKVANGHVRYQGNSAGINLSGAVTPAGLVKVSIKVGEQGADGAGRLFAETGVGTWHGAGANGISCAGRWEAERH
jgi:hypothetical protein